MHAIPCAFFLWACAPKWLAKHGGDEEHAGDEVTHMCSKAGCQAPWHLLLTDKEHNQLVAHRDVQAKGHMRLGYQMNSLPKAM